MQKEEDDVVDDKKRPHTSLWQWIVQNDIVILILVGIIMVVITRVATHVDERLIQPTSHRILNVPPGTQPPSWKLIVEFFLVLIVIYVIVEYVIRPSAPLSHYLLPDTVTEAKQEDDKKRSAKKSGNVWEQSFLAPERTSSSWYA